MKKKDVGKQKKIVFAKLTVKERGKIKGGTNGTNGPIFKPERKC
jgi:hypothetical protein